MFDVFQNRLILHGTLTTTTALRIGSGRNNNAIETDLPVIKDAVGDPLIPGASFKGVLRSRIESLLRAVITTPCACNPKATIGACNPILDTERCIPPEVMKSKKQELAADARQDQKIDYDIALTDWVQQQTCLACSLFGSPWLAARVQVKDWQLSKLHGFADYQIRNGVSIDRDTETAGEGLLYTFEVVPAGTIFNGVLLVENAEAWQLGLLLVGLREFSQGLSLGGATSRGLGGVALDWQWDGASSYLDQANIWHYLEHGGSGMPITEKLRKDWNQAMVAKLNALRKQAGTNDGGDHA